MADYRWVQVFSASRQQLIHPFTGLRPAQFHRLVRLVARRGGDTIADGRPGRPWALSPADRVLLVAVYWRTNLTMRQIGPLFGVSHAYRGNPDVIIPYCIPRDGSELPAWKQDYNAGRRKIRARVEHCPARLKTYKILRDHRRAGRTLTVTAAGIAHLHNIAMAGWPRHRPPGNADIELRDIP